MKKKVIVGMLSAAALAAPVTLAVSCGGSDVKPAFYNYEAYIESGEDGNSGILGQVSEVFSYQTFPDLDTFESMIEQQKTVGGIGSDYLNAKLAKSGKIQKIDFTKVFPSLEGKSKAEIATALQSIYTKEAWDLMASFDTYIGDADNDGTTDHLYEYMVPYFIQNKVVAFDLTGNMVQDATTHTGHWWSQDQYDKLTSGVESDINSVFNTDANSVLSYEEIFTTLHDHGYTTPIINDYWRDNLMIGSEKTGFKNTFADGPEAARQVAGFDELVRIIQIDNESNIALDTDGVSTLGKLVGHDQAVYDVATLYNGDAYDAYTNGEGFEDVTEKSIGVVKPTNSTYLLDGLVIPSYVTGSNLDSMYHVAKDILFEGADQQTDDVMDGSQLLQNFEYVGYTTPFKSLIAGLDDAYFTPEDSDKVDKMAEYISVGMITGANIDTAHITQPITSQVQEQGLRAYKNVMKNHI